MKTKFLSVCLGIAAVVFSLGFFIRTINPASAQTNIGNPDGKMGKYQMSFTSCLTQSGIIYYDIMVWDTETGMSRFYTTTSSYNDKWVKTKNQLPADPLMD